MSKTDTQFSGHQQKNPQRCGKPGRINRTTDGTQDTDNSRVPDHHIDITSQLTITPASDPIIMDASLTVALQKYHLVSTLARAQISCLMRTNHSPNAHPIVKEPADL